jgi:putative tryptophan/tyrosine transport system substrate-binding protein
MIEITNRKEENIAVAKKKRKKLVSDVGVIHSGTSGRPQHGDHIRAFKSGFALFSNGTPRNPRWANDKHGKLDSDAADLVAAGVTVLVAAGGSRSAIAAKKATVTRPIIVTSVSDPIHAAVNVAGVCARTTQYDPQRLKLLLQLLPGRTKIGALYNPLRHDVESQQATLDSMALLLGIKPQHPGQSPLDWQPVNPNGNTQDTEIDDAFTHWTSNNYDAVIVTADPLFNNHIDTILYSSPNVLRKIPAIYQWHEFADAGGLISYGPSLTLAYKLAGTFAGQIDSGVNTIDQLPLLPLDSSELVINLKTAKDLQISVPLMLLAQATDVIV